MLQIFLAMLKTDEEKERFEQFCYKYRIWSDDSYVYIISGNCDEKLLLHMAESVSKKH